MRTDPEVFIRDNTDVLSPPHVPEVRLHLATEAHELWLEQLLAPLGQTRAHHLYYQLGLLRQTLLQTKDGLLAGA